MSGFHRYAIYHLPDDPALAAAGAAWLGWDVVTGAPSVHPDIASVASYTSTPRKYGFHGTLKPPFRLREGTDAGALTNAVAAYAAKTAPIALESLHLSTLGSFLALTPTGDLSALSALAFEIVQTFDAYRAPADAKELQRRRAAGLTPRQEEMLMAWGYPYVADEFRFHLTLTGKLDVADQARAMSTLERVLPPLPRPYPFKSIALAGERSDGNFQMIQRYTLSG